MKHIITKRKQTNTHAEEKKHTLNDKIISISYPHGSYRDPVRRFYPYVFVSSWGVLKIKKNHLSPPSLQSFLKMITSTSKQMKQENGVHLRVTIFCELTHRYSMTDYIVKTRLKL